jgi:hypothetical protein
MTHPIILRNRIGAALFSLSRWSAARGNLGGSLNFVYNDQIVIVDKNHHIVAMIEV